MVVPVRYRWNHRESLQEIGVHQIPQTTNILLTSRLPSQMKRKVIIIFLRWYYPLRVINVLIITVLLLLLYCVLTQQQWQPGTQLLWTLVLVMAKSVVKSGLPALRLANFLVWLTSSWAGQLLSLAYQLVGWATDHCPCKL